MRYVVGVDIGGTKCDALAVDEYGHAVGWGHVDIHDPRSGRGKEGSGRSLESIRHAITDALDGLSCDELHVGGSIPEPWPPDSWLNRPVPRVVRYAVNEWDGGFTLTGETSGIVALAGTGAFVHGLTRDGRNKHLDGLGPHVGDYGSGFHIGLMAIQAAARSNWHPRHQTALQDVVTRVLERSIPRRYPQILLIDFMQNRPDRAEIAALAPLVVETARRGDAIAQRILDEAAEALAETTRDLVEGLDMGRDDYALIGMGGIITHVDSYWAHYVAAVHRFAPRLRPLRTTPPPVVGTALATLFQQHGGKEDAGLRETLLRTAHELMNRKPQPTLAGVPT